MSDKTYTTDQVVALMNRAVKLITDAITLDEPCDDVAHLMVNATATLLDNPNATFDDVVTENYGDVDTKDDPRKWDQWT